MASEGNGNVDRPPARVFLQPIAAPSILGLFGFAGATFIVAAHAAGWYGTQSSPEYLFPFAAAFGGIAQFAAALFAYRARDGLATAMHGTWGSFWIGYGILYLLIAVGALSVPSGAWEELGFWFFALAVITACGTVAALAESLGLVTVLGSLAVGAAFLGVGEYTGTEGWIQAGGWVLVGSSIAAVYTATAMMLEGTFGRVILPLGKYSKAANVPGGKITSPVQYEYGEPGVRQGQ